MKVEELINKLKQMPKELEVYFFWDSNPRSKVSKVIRSQGNYDAVILADQYDSEEYIYQRSKDKQEFTD